MKKFRTNKGKPQSNLLRAKTPHGEFENETKR